ncbi:hypothetical protein MMC17_000542 [Xylographa soralifera]|nr:hypothetical protein [Xylographa soralifera]
MSSGKVCFQFAESGKCRFGHACKYAHIAGMTGVKTKNPTRYISHKSKSKRGPKHHVPTKPNHLDAFFADYPSFRYNRKAPLVQEFYRMCDQFGWDSDDEEKKEASFAFKTAMVHQFNTLYGTDVNDIESWRKLCLALDITPPEGLQACRKAVRKLHVNIVDLVDTQGCTGPVTIFETLGELRTYTIDSGKYFPKESAYAGGVLKFLLREILNEHRRT